jgi:Sulfotransferase domain
MTAEVSGEAPYERRFEALGFGLHYDNMRLLGARDIIIPSIGGAGSALLGNILLELDLNYVDPTREVLLPDGSSMPSTDAISRRIRTSGAGGPSGRRQANQLWPRFVKTHLPAEEFIDCAFGGVLMLVRDPRDALYSWYQYHLGFAEMEWEHVPDSFETFLRQPFFAGPPPADNWAAFYETWLERAAACRISDIIRFEDLKHSPFETMRAALRHSGVQVPDAALRRALERSTFEAMRTHEDRVAETDQGRRQARVMRSGKVEGWTEWMTPCLAEYFSSDQVRSVAQCFGYTLPAPS